MLYCNGLEVHGTWRQRRGLPECKTGKLLMSFLIGTTRYAYIGAWTSSISLILQVKACRRFSHYRNGHPKRECGRIKFDLADVDGDGKTDILMGTIGCNSVPNLSA
ncbi:MAG: hypothetical protein ACLUKN_05655 [Bacilli bacterium]